MAAIASRWLRRKASQHLAWSGGFIQREMVLSEDQNRACGVPHASAVLPRLGSRQPSGKSIPESPSASVSFQPASGLWKLASSTRRACFHPDQTRRAIIQKSLYERTIAVIAEAPWSQPGNWLENYVVRRLASCAASADEHYHLHSRSACGCCCSRLSAGSYWSVPILSAGSACLN